jgi:hypothetical protein
MSLIASLEMNPGSGMTTKEMEYIMKNIEKSKLYKKIIEVDDSKEEDETKPTPKIMRLDSVFD